MDTGKFNPKSEIHGPLYRKKPLGHVSHTTGLRPRADLMSNAASNMMTARCFNGINHISFTNIVNCPV